MQSTSYLPETNANILYKSLTSLSYEIHQSSAWHSNWPENLSVIQRPKTLHQKVAGISYKPEKAYVIVKSSFQIIF